MRIKGGFTYILTNNKHSVFYVGVTNNITRRTHEHKSKKIKGFTLRYNLDKLVWYQYFSDITYAILTEKKIKNRNREFKVSLVNELNSKWQDLPV